MAVNVRTGWNCSITCLTAVDPQGPSTTLPPDMTGRSSSSSIATVSIAEACGGTWVMSTAEPGCLGARDEGAQPFLELVLLELPGGVPRGRIGRRESDQLAPVREANDAVVRVDDAVRILEQRVDLVRVVVARDQVERRAALVEALRGQLHPRRQPILDRLEKALLEDAADRRARRVPLRSWGCRRGPCRRELARAP